MADMTKDVVSRRLMQVIEASITTIMKLITKSKKDSANNLLKKKYDNMLAQLMLGNNEYSFVKLDDKIDINQFEEKIRDYEFKLNNYIEERKLGADKNEEYEKIIKDVNYNPEVGFEIDFDVKFQSYSNLTIINLKYEDFISKILPECLREEKTFDDAIIIPKEEDEYEKDRDLSSGNDKEDINEDMTLNLEDSNENIKEQIKDYGSEISHQENIEDKSDNTHVKPETEKNEDNIKENIPEDVSEAIHEEPSVSINEKESELTPDSDDTKSLENRSEENNFINESSQDNQETHNALNNEPENTQDIEQQDVVENNSTSDNKYYEEDRRIDTVSASENTDEVSVSDAVSSSSENLNVASEPDSPSAANENIEYQSNNSEYKNYENYNSDSYTDNRVDEKQESVYEKQEQNNYNYENKTESYKTPIDTYNNVSSDNKVDHDDKTGNSNNDNYYDKRNENAYEYKNNEKEKSTASTIVPGVAPTPEFQKIGDGNTLYEKLELVHDSTNYNHDDFFKKFGEASLMTKDATRETSFYQGYKESKNPVKITEAMINNDAKFLREQMYEKMKVVNDSGDLKYMNQLLKENGNLTGKNGVTSLNFSNSVISRKSTDEIMEFMKAKGLIKVSGANYKDMLKDMNLSDFKRLCGLKGQSDIIGENLFNTMKKVSLTECSAYNMITLRNKNALKSIKQSYKKATKQDSTFKGLNSATDALHAAKSTKAMLSSAYRAMFDNKEAGLKRKLDKAEKIRNSNNAKFNKIQNKYKKISKKNKKIKDKDTLRLRKKENGIVNKSKKGVQNRTDAFKLKRIDKKIKRKIKIRKVIGNNNYNKLKIVGNRIKKPFNVLHKMNSNILKGIRKATVFIQGLIKAALVFIGKILFILFAIGIIAVIVVVLLTTAINMFNGDDGKSTDDPYSSSLGIVCKDLMKDEIEWAQKLKTLGDTVKIQIDKISYGKAGQSIKEYCNSIGLKYEDSTEAVIGEKPFTNAPDDAFKRIKTIDGGNELLFMGADGGIGQTSNIKEILSMVSVYYRQNDIVGKEYSDDDSKAEVNKTMTQPSSYLKGSSSEIYNDVSTSSSQHYAANQNDSNNSAIFMTYAKPLFEASHQEIYDLELLMYPTWHTLEKYINENSDTIHAERAEINDGNGDPNQKDYSQNPSGIEVPTGIVMCPETKYNGYGCQEYNKFYYRADSKLILYTKNADGSLNDVSASVHPKDDDYCVAPNGNIHEFYEVFNKFDTCWNVTTTSGKSDIDGSDDLNDGHQISQEKLNNLFKGQCDYRGVKSSQCISSNEYKITVWTNETSSQKKGPEGHRYTQYYQHYKTFIFKHNCQGIHTGYYCGGHLKLKVTGIVYGLTDMQARQNGNFTGKVKNGEYIKSTSIDKDLLKNAIDIFDIDTAIDSEHPKKLMAKDWDGWTKDNMEWAIAIATQDWADLYGIHVGSSIGGTPMSEAEIRALSDLVTTQIYNETPEQIKDRIDHVKKAMSYVGNMGYSQNHHLCPLEGPCIHGSSKCALSDCSGFTSNIWIDKLGQIYTTATFKNTFGGSNFHKFSDGGCKPGDILLHYDSGGNHALLYVGKDADGLDYSIDCTTVNSIGQVRYAHRSYYNDCYYISMENT